MQKIALLLLLITISVHSHKGHKHNGYECMHDQMDGSKLVPPDYLEKFDEVYGERRLQAAENQPLRITVDYKELDNPKNGEGMTPEIKNYIKKIMEAAQIFLGKLIKVQRRTKPIKMTWGDVCFDMRVTKEIQEVGLFDSDLHIYVSYSNQPNFSYLANAIYCQLDPNPVVGRIKFNIGTMGIDESSFQSFQDNFSISFHEILHILGFSANAINYWIDPDTGKPYGDNFAKIQKSEKRWDIDNVTKVFSKNILRVARNHYACPTIDGMYLENQGSPGSMGSHWERDLLGNEIMTPSIVAGQFSISEFTAALLLDTGYYAEINSNMLMPLFFGKNKGCDFYHKTCNAPGIEFPEFPSEQTNDTCDMYNIFGSNNGKYDTFSQCSNVSAATYSCENSKEYPVDARLRQNSGPGARCFRSNAAVKGEDDQEIKSRCFKAKCGADNQSVEISIWDTEKVICKYPNQVINLDNETKTSQGIVKCPSDFEQFCTFPKKCPNQCSNNGVCNNGTCICLGGWAGEDCSKQCPSQNAWDGSRCVPRCPSGTFKNNDNVCKPTCPFKYYKDANTSSCELCHVTCQICNGPLSNQCSACNNGYSLSGNTCVESKCNSNCATCSGPAANQCTSCVSGKYLDSNKNCQPCKSPCLACSSETQCTGCISGYFMNIFNGQCLPNNTCDNSCQTCSAWRNPNSCTSCREGYTLTNGQCIKCQKQCKKCSQTSSRCVECTSGYTFDAPNQRCYLECDSSCNECSQAKNPKACTSCPGQKYLKDGQCLPCDVSCSYCKDSPKFCLQCSYGYKLDADKGTCTSICRAQEFLDNDQSCKPCDKNCASCSYFDYFCTSCFSGYTLNDETKTCKPGGQACHPSCNTCKKFNDDKGCDSCRSGMYLSNGQCLNCSRNCATCNSGNSCQACLSGFQLQNGQCVEKQATQCHQSCKKCSNPPSGNRTFCTSCPDGSFLNGETCQLCQLPCRTCSEAPSSCTSCDENQYTFNSSKRSCDAKTCHPSCRTCSKPNDSFSCQSCSDGFYLKGSGCVQCNQNCKTCNNSSTTCTSCAQGFVLNNGQCQQQAQPNPNKCDPSCATCSRNNDALGCLSCSGNTWLQTNQDRSLGRCLPCDTSCNGCSDTYRCTACSGENVLDQSGYCQPCPSNQKFSNGRCINKRNLQNNFDEITSSFSASNAPITIFSLSTMIILFIFQL